MKKIYTSSILVFIIHSLVNSLQAYGSHAFTVSEEQPAFIFVSDDDFKINLQSDNEFKGFITTGLGPCFAIMVCDKETKKPIALSHFAPEASYEPDLKAKKYLENHLHNLLYQIEKNLRQLNDPRINDTDEEEDEKHLLFDILDIYIVGGQNPDSSNSINAVMTMHEEQFYPIVSYHLGSVNTKQVLDLTFEKQKISIKKRNI